MHEFELIQRYFQSDFPSHPAVLLGIGDDAALCAWSAEHSLVVAVDTLVAGVHFPLDTAASDIGYKALAVNLSDMAAMGAQPLWFTLALTLPEADSKWIKAFTCGLRELAQAAQVALIGGDTTRGTLSISIQMHGSVPTGQALLRQGAQVGDGIYVTGTLGDAGLGLAVAQGQLHLAEAEQNTVLQRLNRPTPRWLIGLKLRGVAHSAIDISDGLVADLGHILQASGVGARLQLADLPLSYALRSTLSVTEAQQLALTAGDDYELCFTVAPQHEARLMQQITGVRCTRIGVIEAEPGLRCVQKDGTDLDLKQRGYQHFDDSLIHKT